MYKYLFLCLFTLFLGLPASTQVPEPIKTIPTPTAWSFAQYGKVDVTHFTGLPVIQVPLTSTSYKDHQVPLALTYNTSGFRPDMHAGPAGTGWTLNYGGVITRQVNGLPDEFYYYMDNICDCFEEEHDDNYGEYKLGFIKSAHDPAFGIDYLLDASYCFLNAEYAADNGHETWVKYPYPVPYKGHWWNSICYYTARYFKHYRIPAYHPGNDYVYMGTQDLQSDEYSFNVMGHSGKFYFRNEMTIQVIADRQYKVELLGADMDIPSTLLQPNSGPQAGADCSKWMFEFSPWKAYNRYPKTISGFKLIADDGTTFTFGNRYPYQSAIDYSISENYAPGQAGHGQQQVSDYWVANAWYLSSVTFPDGKNIFYEYDRGEYNRALFRSEFAYEIFQNNPSCGIANANYTLPGQTTQGKITSPVYLSRVYSDLIDLRFYYSNTDESNNLTASAVQNFKWKKVDSIQAKDYNGQNSVWKFSYYPLASYGQRLYLQSVEKFNAAGKSIGEKWRFEYDNSLALPDYNVSQNDHWGFWNGTTTTSVIGYTNAQMDNLRSPTPANTRAGTLKKIYYPTGGYTEYTYELNSYSKKVKEQRHLGVDNLGYNKAAGGLRIRQVKSVDTIAGTAMIKDYYYVNGYTPGLSEAQIAALPSSGILNQYDFIYHWQNINVQMYNYPGCLQNLRMTLTSNQPINSTFDDYHIGYTTVIERLRDSSYTSFTYSNHDNGYRDDSTIARLNPFSTPYMQCSKRTMERGKLLEEAVYHKSGKLLQRTKTVYNRIANDTSSNPDTYIERFSIQILTATNGIGDFQNTPMNYLFADKFKEFTYRFLPTKVTTVTWQPNSNDSITIEKNIQYTNPSHGQPTLVTTKNSDGSEKKDILKYALDYPGTFVLNWIPKTTLIEKITTRKATPSDPEMVTEAVLNEYGLPSHPGAVIKNIHKLALTSPIPLSSMTTTVPITTGLNDANTWTKDYRYQSEILFKKYDDYDNPVEYQTRAGFKTYGFMGYNGLKLLGKVSTPTATWYNPAYTSFEQLTIRNAIDDYWETSTIPDNPSWILTGTRSTDHAFTGQHSFIGRAKYNGVFIEAIIYVAARADGAAPTLERYNTATNDYATLPATPTVIREKNGWKVYRFYYSNAGLQLVVNSNGNYMDELRMGARSDIGEDQTFLTYTYKDGLLAASTDPAYKRAFFEYDNWNRIATIRDEDKNIVKQFDYQYQASTDPSPNWQFTGNSRCKPCPANGAYTLNVLQNEEIDTNPNSPTYNQTRWADTGMPGNCVITPDWQNTGNTQCLTDASGYRTGTQRIEKRDMNPCSGTYNQLQYVDITNVSACPPNAPNWQFTGGSRCKPCPYNGAYTIDVRQLEQIDNNPNSATYNQTRWVDADTPGSCVIAPNWQNTATAIRCRQVNGNNTGEQEQEQRDLNPCSGTSNQTRWIVVGTNTTACPVPVYARLTVENEYGSSPRYGTVIVRYYQDAACTIPKSVSNFTVKWGQNQYLYNGNEYHTYDYSTSGLSGTSSVLSYPALTYEEGFNETYYYYSNYYYFVLLPDPAYVIVY